MRECGEDLLVDMSEVLFNELAFFKLMQGIVDVPTCEQGQQTNPLTSTSTQVGITWSVLSSCFIQLETFQWIFVLCQRKVVVYLEVVTGTILGIYDQKRATLILVKCLNILEIQSCIKLE